MKKYLLILFVLSLVLSACSSSAPADELVQDVVEPPTQPAMGEPIQFEKNVEVILSNETDIISVFYLGPDQFGKEQWTCVSISNQNCAERHGEDADMVFYLEAKKIGETSGNSAQFAVEWEVVK